MNRRMTQFEREHGYSPCPLRFGGPGCDVDLKLHPKGSICSGTWEECVGYKNANRFAGVIVAGHPVGALLAGSILAPTVTFDDDTDEEALRRGSRS